MIEVIVLTSAGCHLCQDAKEHLAELSEEFPLSVREVAIASPEGLKLLQLHRPAMPPAVLVDGELFSAGRLPRKKLRKRLEWQAA
jgi:Glutaredoxin-like domain (DUF836)